ncbi:MAG TPA: cytochrome d ubiquinol oxidase subunit II [Flavisolibacter sp.]|nr:cytochrome d ubiquinol oxidase subunit II [Flavisolibacter sp.]
MRRTASFVFILAALSAVSGFLLSKASLTGRVGISLFYKEYKFLKTWWQGALVVFAVLLLVLWLLGLAERNFPKRKAVLFYITTILLALAGLFFTYHDFTHTTTHRLLGERFHTGAYLFWLDWILISLFYLTKKSPQPAEP